MLSINHSMSISPIHLINIILNFILPLMSPYKSNLSFISLINIRRNLVLTKKKDKSVCIQNEYSLKKIVRIFCCLTSLDLWRVWWTAKIFLSIFQDKIIKTQLLWINSNISLLEESLNILKMKQKKILLPIIDGIKNSNLLLRKEVSIQILKKMLLSLIAMTLTLKMDHLV